MPKSGMTISSVEYKDAVKPVLFEFQDGKIPEGRMVPQMYKDKEGQLLFALAANNQVYTEKIQTNKTHNTFIAIPNSDRTKVHLVAIDCVKFTPDSERGFNNNAEVGLKKTKLHHVVESVNNHLIKTDIDVATDQVDLNSTISEIVHQLKIDVDADKVEEIYKLHDIVPKNVLESLNDEADRILSSDDMSGLSDFVASNLNQLNGLDSAYKKNACLIWLYVDCLIKFINTNMKTIATKKYRACSYSDLANNDIIKKFTVVGTLGRNRPNTMKDKCLCYVLVLCLINLNYMMDVTSLASQVSVSIKRIIEFAKILRFHTKSTKVFLKLPLPAIFEAKASKKRK